MSSFITSLIKNTAEYTVVGACSKMRALAPVYGLLRGLRGAFRDLSSEHNPFNFKIFHSKHPQVGAELNRQV